ncbi:DUF5011 domain-containing protein [Erysipelotrichaceae bacterium OttesenSCG-928-M19]|nr:DUF5011 domain-containing protein [Erysipelotrichaceae bacterium OttesenSCG-928-M19]
MVKRKIIIFLMFFGMVINSLNIMANEQAPITDWDALLDSRSTLRKVIKTKSNDLVVVGFSTETNNNDGVIFKYKQDGTLIWKQTIIGNKNDDFSGVIETSDGDFIAVGMSNSTDIVSTTNKGDYDGIIARFDGATGALKKINLIGGNRADYFDGIVEISKDELIVTGSTATSVNGDITTTNKGSSDILIMSVAANTLTSNWDFQTGGSRLDDSFEAIKTRDGNLIVVGYAYSDDYMTSYGQSDAIIIKFDYKNKTLLWSKRFGADSFDGLYSVAELEDDKFIAVGYSNQPINNRGNIIDVNQGSYDGLVIDFDGAGNINSQKLIGSIHSDMFYDIEVLADNNYIIAGSSANAISNNTIENISRGSNDGLLMKFKRDGSKIYDTLAGNGGSDCFLSLTTIGDYIFTAGYSNYSTKVVDITSEYYGAYGLAGLTMKFGNEKPEILAKEQYEITLGDQIAIAEAFEISASDFEDGDLTSKVIINSDNVTFNKIGSYEIILKVSDKHHQETTKTVTLIIKEKPVIEEEEIDTEKDKENNKDKVNKDKSNKVPDSGLEDLYYALMIIVLLGFLIVIEKDKLIE